MQSFGGVVCATFRRDLLLGIHNFSAVGGHTFRLALYSASASIDANTTTYTTVGEIAGAGYTAGGSALVSTGPQLNGSDQGVVSFADLTFALANFTCRKALIYNTTAVGLNAVGFIDFGVDQMPNNVDFTINMPLVGGPNPFVIVR